MKFLILDKNIFIINTFAAILNLVFFNNNPVNLIVGRINLVMSIIYLYLLPNNKLTKNIDFR